METLCAKATPGRSNPMIRIRVSTAGIFWIIVVKLYVVFGHQTWLSSRMLAPANGFWGLSFGLRREEAGYSLYTCLDL